MKRKKLFGIMMGLILIIIPFISMNIRQVHSVNEEMSSSELQTNAYWDIGGFRHVWYNLGYLRGPWYEVVDWSFSDADDNRDLTVMFMTEANYQAFASGDPYNYGLLSSGKLSDSGSFVVSTSNNYRIVFWNDNFLRNTFYADASHDAIKTEVYSATFTYYDTDDDGYDDKFRLNLGINLNYHIASSVRVDYTIYVGSEMFTNYVYVSDTFGEMVYLNYDVEDAKTYFLQILVYYSSSSIPDDEAFKDTKYLYPLGYGITPTPTTSPNPSDPENDKPYGLYIGLPLGIGSLISIVTTISVTLIRKRKKKVPQETEVIESELEQSRLCPECMEITDASEIFCGNCGIKLNEAET